MEEAAITEDCRHTGHVVGVDVVRLLNMTTAQMSRRATTAREEQSIVLVSSAVPFFPSSI